MRTPTEHDPPRPHRAGSFPDAVRGLRDLSVGDASRRDGSEILDTVADHLAAHGRARPGARQLRRALALERGAARLDLHSGPYRERQVCAGRNEVMQGPRRLDAAWLQAPPLVDLLAVLDREGEEARVVGGAVRNSLLDAPIGDIDIATTAVPDEVIRRVAAAGYKPVPTGIEHG